MTEFLIKPSINNKSLFKYKNTINEKGGGVIYKKLCRFYQAAYGDWLVKLGASIEHGKVDDTDSKTDVLVFTEIKYRLN